VPGFIALPTRRLPIITVTTDGRENDRSARKTTDRHENEPPRHANAFLAAAAWSSCLPAVWRKICCAEDGAKFFWRSRKILRTFCSAAGYKTWVEGRRAGQSQFQGGQLKLAIFEWLL